MSGSSSGDRPDATRSAQDTSGRIWEELSSNNERLVPLPRPGSLPGDVHPGIDNAAQCHPHRGRCDIRQVVSAA
jgi:hypothetical protein